MKTVFFFFLLFAISFSLPGQQLSKTEQQIIQHIETDMQATLQLLQQSVDINSGTYNLEGVRKVGAVYAEEFKKLGFNTEWVSLPDSIKRAGHLVAWRKGKKGKKVFIIGHLDTVFEPDMPANPYKKLNENEVTGQGVSDMKGGDVEVIAALKALYKEGLLDDVTITVYFTGDEEEAGYPRSVSRGDFMERARQHDIALGFEGANGMHTIATARRGFSSWQLEVEATQAHSSGVFGQAGYGAIYEAARIINAFREKLSHEKYLTFNPGIFIGGSEMSYDSLLQTGEASGKTNIISPKAFVNGDLRFISAEQKENARKVMREIVAESLPGTKARISFKDGIPSMPPTKGNEALVKTVNEVSMALGYGEVRAGDPGARGAGDISYVASYLDCIDGLGVIGRGEHAPGETLDLRTFPMLIKRAALVIYRLTR